MSQTSQGSKLLSGDCPFTFHVPTKNLQRKSSQTVRNHSNNGISPAAASRLGADMKCELCVPGPASSGATENSPRLGPCSATPASGMSQNTKLTALQRSQRSPGSVNALPRGATPGQRGGTAASVPSASA